MIEDPRTDGVARHRVPGAATIWWGANAVLWLALLAALTGYAIGDCAPVCQLRNTDG